MNELSPYVTVQAFGAKGDGSTNDYDAIQRALDWIGSVGGGTVFVPAGPYLTTGYLNMVYDSVTLQGERGSAIITANDGDFRKVNISGAAGCSILNLGIYAGRVSSNVQVYTGTINLYSAPYVTIRDCTIADTRGLGIHIRGNTYLGTIENNTISDYHIGIFGDSNDISGVAYNRMTIRGNRILSSWGAYGGTNYFGAIKLQNVGFESRISGVLVVPAASYGHLVQSNTIYRPSQMGIEMFGHMTASTVASNVIEDSGFGISIAATSSDITVENNILLKNTIYGVEVANSDGMTVQGNMIEGLSGYTALTPDGIIIDNSQRCSVLSNIIRNCTTTYLKLAVGTIDTTSSCESILYANNVIYNGVNNGAIGFNCHANSANIKVMNNIFDFQATGGYFIFLDSNDCNASGVQIAGNDFVGKVNQWGLLYYNNGSTTFNTLDSLVEDNRTIGVTFCQYGFFENHTNNPPQRAVHRNNYGPTGTAGYSIPDLTIPAGDAHYGDSNVAFGYQFYKQVPLTFTGAINSTSGEWFKIYSLDQGYQQSARFKVVDAVQSPYSFDGSNENLDFQVSIPVYGQGNPAIIVEPRGNYFNNIVAEIVADNPSAGSIGEVWMRVRSGSQGISGYQLNVFGSDGGTLNAFTPQYGRPSFASNSVGVILTGADKSALKVTQLSMGSLEWTGPSATSANAGSASALPATPAGYTVFTTSGITYKTPFYLN